WRERGMEKCVNGGTIEVNTEGRDEGVTSLMAHKARLEAEVGHVAIRSPATQDDNTKVLSFEMYRDAAAFEVHLNGPSLAQLREEIAGIVTKLQGFGARLRASGRYQIATIQRLQEHRREYPGLRQRHYCAAGGRSLQRLYFRRRQDLASHQGRCRSQQLRHPHAGGSQRLAPGKASRLLCDASSLPPGRL